MSPISFPKGAVKYLCNAALDVLCRSLEPEDHQAARLLCHQFHQKNKFYSETTICSVRHNQKRCLLLLRCFETNNTVLSTPPCLFVCFVHLRWKRRRQDKSLLQAFNTVRHPLHVQINPDVQHRHIICSVVAKLVRQGRNWIYFYFQLNLQCEIIALCLCGQELTN